MTAYHCSPPATADMIPLCVTDPPAATVPREIAVAQVFVAVSSTMPLQSLSRPSQISALGSTWPEHVTPQAPAAQVCVPLRHTPTPAVPAGPV